jgi:hypothetical protein
MMMIFSPADVVAEVVAEEVGDLCANVASGVRDLAGVSAGVCNLRVDLVELALGHLCDCCDCRSFGFHLIPKITGEISGVDGARCVVAVTKDRHIDGR